MSENPEQTDPDVPHDEDLDIEGPNESAQAHNPADEDSEEAQDQA